MHESDRRWKRDTRNKKMYMSNVVNQVKVNVIDKGGLNQLGKESIHTSVVKHNSLMKFYECPYMVDPA